MGEASKRPGVNLAPSAMVDSVADWPLRQVVELLKRKEKEDTGDSQPSRLHCRSTVKSLVDVIDSVASDYGESRNRMCRWLSYHAIAIAREDPVISKLERAQSTIREACLPEDDTDTLDVMNSLVPYAPRVMDDNPVHLLFYDAWVLSDFEEMARVCGVYKYRIAQVYLIKSIVSGDIEKFGETASRLLQELTRWDTWMSFRLGALEILVERKSG